MLGGVKFRSCIAERLLGGVKFRSRIAERLLRGVKLGSRIGKRLLRCVKFRSRIAERLLCGIKLCSSIGKRLLCGIKLRRGFRQGLIDSIKFGLRLSQAVLYSRKLIKRIRQHLIPLSQSFPGAFQLGLGVGERLLHGGQLGGGSFQLRLGLGQRRVGAVKFVFGVLKLFVFALYIAAQVLDQRLLFSERCVDLVQSGVRSGKLAFQLGHLGLEPGDLLVVLSHHLRYGGYLRPGFFHGLEPLIQLGGFLAQMTGQRLGQLGDFLVFCAQGSEAFLQLGVDLLYVPDSVRELVGFAVKLGHLLQQCLLAVRSAGAFEPVQICPCVRDRLLERLARFVIFA